MILEYLGGTQNEPEFGFGHFLACVPLVVVFATLFVNDEASTAFRPLVDEIVHAAAVAEDLVAVSVF